MQNEDQNTSGQIIDNGGVRQEPLPVDLGGTGGVGIETNSLSALPQESPLLQKAKEDEERSNRGIRRFMRPIPILALVLVLSVTGIVLSSVLGGKEDAAEQSNSVGSQYDTQEIPLGGFEVSEEGVNFGIGSVVVNGPLQANSGLVVSPSGKPTSAVAGQLYYDQGTNQLAYFNGTEFVALSASENPEVVESLGGATGQLALGGGLGVVGNQLVNNGVLSFGGQSGAITVGNGLVLVGSVLQNSGVLSIVPGSGNVSVTTGTNGQVTIDMIGAGTGTVTSSGGTAGRLPLFTTSQNIEDSIISQSGLTVTVSGDLSVVTGGLSLSNALTVSNGGTGTASLAANGVIVGNGTSALSSVAAGGSGLCLLSTAGAPTWAACPGGSGVSSLNSLTGALSIANASAAGSTVTIDDAATGSKGIASFNATNFSVASGAVNTIQNINTGATPTFAGVNTNNITPAATLTVGATGQQLILQGNASTQLTATGGGFTTTVGFSGTPVGAVNYNFDRSAVAGTYTICSSIGNCAGVGGSVGGTGTLNRLAKFTVSGSTIGDSTISDNGTTVTTTVDLAIQGGDVTVGVPSSQTGSMVFAHNGSANTGTITQGALTGPRTYTLPDATGTICLDTGNCSGSGSTNTLQAAYDAGNSIATSNNRDLDILLSNDTVDSNLDIVVEDDSTSYVSVSRENGTGTNSPNQLLLVDNLDLNQTIANGIVVQAAAGAITDGVDVSDAELLNAINVGDNIIVGGAATIDFTNFDVTSGGNVTAAGNMNLSGGGQYQVSGVQISSANLSNDSNLAKLNGSQTFTGNLNAFQNAANSTNAFNVQNLLGTRVLTVDTSNGEVELGTSSTMNGRLVFYNVADTNTVTIVPGSLTDNRTLTLPDDSGVLCLNTGNCLGAGATLQTAYNFSAVGTTPKIKLDDTLKGFDIQDSDAGNTGDLFDVRESNALGLGAVMFGVGESGAVTLQNSANSTTALRLLTQGGTTVLVGDTLNGQIIVGQSSTLDGKIVFNNATNGNQITLTTAAAGAPQSITLPNASGTVCLTSGNCAGVGGTGDILQNGNSFSGPMTIGTNDAFDLNLETGGTTRVTVESDGSQVTFANGVDLILQAAGSYISNAQGQTNSESFGSAANVSAAGATAIGAGASAGFASSIAFGRGATTTAANQIVIGSSASAISQVVIGNGVTNASPSGFTLQGTSASGTDVAGADVTVAGGQSTGTAFGGSINFQISAAGGVSGGSANALSTVASFGGATGAALFQNATDSTQGFRIKNAAADNLFVADTSNSRIGIALGANNTPTDLSAAGLQVQGAISLTGTGSASYRDNYSTPDGGTLGSRINVQNETLSASQSVIYVGLLSGSDSGARGITVLDDRASAHDPSIGVISPDESKIFGLSWEGSDANAYLKSSSNNIVIASGGTDVIGAAATAVSLFQDTTVSATKTLTVTSGLTSLTGNTTGDALNVSNSTSTGNIAVFSDNATAILTLANGGSALFRNQTNSASAFQVQSASGSETLFTTDTAARSGSGGNLIKIGNSTGTDGDTTVLQLDSATANPTTNLSALNGGLFYNSTTHKVSLIENGAVKIICNTTDLGCGTGTVTLQNAYTNSAGAAPSILTTSANAALTVQTANTGGIAAGNELFGVRASQAGDTIGNSLFTVNSTGVGINIGGTGNPATTADLSFGEGADRTINILGRATNAAGRSLTIQAGAAGAGASAFNGGDVTIQGGAAAGTGSADGGTVRILAGNDIGTGETGQVIIQAGSGDRNEFFSVRNSAGNPLLVVNSANGDVYLGTAGPTQSYDLTLQGTTNRTIGVDDSSTTDGGNLTLRAGTTTATNGSGGSIILTAGDKDGAGTAGNVLVKNIADINSALQVQNAAGTETLFSVDTTARGASGGNLIKVGNSTGTDGNLTILKLDASTADPTSNLSALNGGLFYNSTTNKISLIENGTVKIICNTTDLGCGTGSPRLDTIQAATGAGSVQDSNANSIFWNWDFTSAGADGGLNISESSASTSGTQDQQALLILTALSGSTASPLQVTAGGTDVADVWINLSNAADFEVRDNGTKALSVQDDGLVAVGNVTATAKLHVVGANGSSSVGTNGLTVVSGNGNGAGFAGGANSLTTGSGGNSTSASAAGNGGATSIVTGAGGNVTGAGSGNGGAGGAITITAGNGGTASVNNGGNGGSITITAGSGGSGISSDGNGGFVVLKGGGTPAIGTPGGVSVESPTNNTTTAFRVLNASSVVNFVVDTSNSRVYIGDPTTDTTGALLVLDTKTSSGDPSVIGISEQGAMYYNSATDKMRCYEGDYWWDCRETSRTGLRYRAEYLSTVDEAPFAGFGTGTTSFLAGVAAHPGIVRMETDTSSTLYEAQGINNTNDTEILFNANDTWRHESLLRIPTLSGSGQTFVVLSGFADSIPTDPTDGCYFRYSDTVNAGEWQGECADAGASTCDTNQAVAANTWYRLTIIVTSTLATFQINGTTACTVSANIPITAGNETGINTGIRKTAGNTERTLDLDYLEVAAQLSR